MSRECPRYADAQVAQPFSGTSKRHGAGQRAGCGVPDYLAHLDGFTIEWFIGHDAQAVNERLSRLTVPADDYYVWITGEGKVVKT